MRTLVERVLAAGPQDEGERFVALLHASLWGNRADLSNIALAARPEDDMGDPSGDNLLIDHTEVTWALVASGCLRRADFVCDNAGLETLLNLALTGILRSPCSRDGSLNCLHPRLGSRFKELARREAPLQSTYIFTNPSARYGAPW